MSISWADGDVSHDVSTQPWRSACSRRAFGIALFRSAAGVIYRHGMSSAAVEVPMIGAATARAEALPERERSGLPSVAANSFVDGFRLVEGVGVCAAGGHGRRDHGRDAAKLLHPAAVAEQAAARVGRSVRMRPC